MKIVDHIIWEIAPYDGRVSGLLEITVYWHGGGHDHMIIQGTYEYGSYPVRDSITTPFGKITPDDIIGASGFSLHRVGEIIYTPSA